MTMEYSATSIIIQRASSLFDQTPDLSLLRPTIPCHWSYLLPFALKSQYRFLISGEWSWEGKNWKWTVSWKNYKNLQRSWGMCSAASERLKTLHQQVQVSIYIPLLCPFSLSSIKDICMLSPLASQQQIAILHSMIISSNKISCLPSCLYY